MYRVGKPCGAGLGVIGGKVFLAWSCVKVYATVVVSYLHKKTSGNSRVQTLWADTSVVPLELACSSEARTRGVRQPVRIFESRIGSTDLAQYTVWTAVFKPTNLGCSVPISPSWQPCRDLCGPALPGRMNASLRMVEGRPESASDSQSSGLRANCCPTRKGDVAR